MILNNPTVGSEGRLLVSIFDDSLNHYDTWGNRMYTRRRWCECGSHGGRRIKLDSHLQYFQVCATEWDRKFCTDRPVMGLGWRWGRPGERSYYDTAWTVHLEICAPRVANVFLTSGESTSS